MASDVIVLEYGSRLDTKKIGSGQSCTFIHAKANEKNVPPPVHYFSCFGAT